MNLNVVGHPQVMINKIHAIMLSDRRTKLHDFVGTTGIIHDLILHEKLSKNIDKMVPRLQNKRNRFVDSLAGLALFHSLTVD